MLFHSARRMLGIAKAQTRRPADPAGAPSLERLEPRVLLSADLSGGVLTITGTDAADKISVKATKNAGEVIVNGPDIAKNTHFTGVDSVVINALGGNDKISVAKNINAAGGTPMPFNIDAGEGNNSVTSGSGDDTIVAGAGNDKISDAGGNNTIDAGDGNNSVTTRTGNDTITTGSGNDRITDSGGNNTIDAGDGNNTISTKTGDDNILAGTGNDRITDSGGNNNVAAGDGVNNIHTGSGDDNITAGSANDFAQDSGGNNTFALDGGNDVIVIHGNTGTNFIDPGTGNPTVISSVNNTVVLPKRPDDTPNTATPFKLAFGGRATLVGTAPASGTPDFFVFTASRADQITASIASPSNGLVQLAVTDPAGNPLLVTDSSQNASSVTFPVVAGQRVFLRVSSQDGFDDQYIATLTSAGSVTPGNNFVVTNTPGSTFTSPTLFSFPVNTTGALTGSFPSVTDSAVFSFTPTQTGTLFATPSGTNATSFNIIVQNGVGSVLAQTNTAAGVTTAVATVNAGQQVFVTMTPSNAIGNFPQTFVGTVSLI